ncbi:hypothetical protein IWX48DRAFT_630159 [Phyllosticta citricarpa]
MPSPPPRPTYTPRGAVTSFRVNMLRAVFFLFLLLFFFFSFSITSTSARPTVQPPNRHATNHRSYPNRPRAPCRRSSKHRSQTYPFDSPSRRFC